MQNHHGMVLKKAGLLPGRSPNVRGNRAEIITQEKKVNRALLM